MSAYDPPAAIDDPADQDADADGAASDGADTDGAATEDAGTEGGQTRRSYHSPSRQARARQTERRIIDAATELLTTRGWSGTTMADVARAAGVSPAMLYKVFPGKSALIKRAYDIAMVGDQEDAPFRARPEFLAVTAERDARRKCAGYTGLIRHAVERVLPIYRQLHAAVAAGETELRDVADTADAERLFGATGIVDDIGSLVPLPEGSDRGRVIDRVWVLMAPDYWALLVVRRGWTWDDTERHVAEQLATLLLGCDAAPGCDGSPRV